MRAISKRASVRGQEKNYMMQEEIGQNFQGVEIPPETVADSNAKKAKRVRTLAELPVSRDAVNLLGEVVLAVKNGSHSLRKYYDEMMHASFELITSIGMADLSRDPEQRIEYINCTLALVNTVRSAFTVLRRFGALQKDTDNKQKALVKRIIAQLVGWRDYTRVQGAESGIESKDEEAAK